MRDGTITQVLTYKLLLFVGSTPTLAPDSIALYMLAEQVLYACLTPLPLGNRCIGIAARLNVVIAGSTPAYDTCYSSLVEQLTVNQPVTGSNPVSKLTTLPR